MSSMLITKDTFDQMRAVMDKDGDGEVNKEEFKEAYKSVYDGPLKDFDEHYDFVWSKIDTDNDGNLTVDELAKFYGFGTGEDGEAGEMTDEQILQALAMAAEMDARKAGPAQAAKPAPEQKKQSAKKDTSIKIFNTDKKLIVGDKSLKSKSNPGAEMSDKAIADTITMMELLSSAIFSDLKSDKEDKESVIKMLETPGVIVRVEDQSGEMPLHKLARFKVPSEPAEKKKIFEDTYTMIVNMVLKKTRDEAKDADRALVNDINKQDASGKTPMFRAIEMKNRELIEILNGLDRDRPDGLLVTAAGWSVLHQAVHTDDFDVVKDVVKGLQKDGGRIRVLINLKDKQGRQPLHIAAYKCTDTDIIQFLMDNGASGMSKDTTGLDAPALAGKANRRVSKELIEENVRRSSKEGGQGGRRQSKEIVGLPPGMVEDEEKRRISRESMDGTGGA